MDKCDKCGKLAELGHNEETGLALCDRCDAREQEHAKTADPETVLIRLAVLIKNEVNKQGIGSHAKLAALSGVSRPAISKLLRAEHYPTLDSVVKIAAALNCPAILDGLLSVTQWQQIKDEPAPEQPAPKKAPQPEKRLKAKTPALTTFATALIKKKPAPKAPAPTERPEGMSAVEWALMKRASK